MGVGAGFDGDFNDLFAAYFSTDGDAWVPTGLSGDGAVAHSVWVGEDALIGGCLDCQFDPSRKSPGAVWHSSDGTTWQLSEVRGANDISAVAKVGSTYVAVGGTFTKGLCMRLNAWTSADAASWSSANLIRGDSGCFNQVAELLAIGGSLLLLANVPGGESGVPAGWRSDDGRTWTPIEVEPLGAWNNAAQFGDTVIAAGEASTTAPGGEGSIWLSRDQGQSFVRQVPPLFASGSDLYLASVASTGKTAILVQSGAWDAVLTSPDGTAWETWTDLPGMADYRTIFDSVVATSATIVVFGKQRSSSDEENPWVGTYWTGEPTPGS